jgi:prepilin-type N-terminal cleavage/methylation domain-containing protein
MKIKAFTLLELLIVIIIVGILATLALLQYKPYKENTLDREAQANLKLIYAAERIYKFESDSNEYFGPLLTNETVNDALKLQLATTNPNWQYTIKKCTAGGNSRFSARAERTLPEPDKRYLCLKSLDPSATGDPSVDEDAVCDCP